MTPAICGELHEVKSPARYDERLDTLERLLRGAKPVVPSKLRRAVAGAVLAAGRIRPQRRIGGGATGTVYEALDGESRVALKVLNDLNPHQIYRLKQEFRLLADFEHPNVISMYELFGNDADWFFTMELVEGRPFDEYWAVRSQSQPGEIAAADVLQLRSLFTQLIEGVAAVHRAGLLHRDLKPSNVLVEPSGRVVILDFGLVSEQHAGGVGQTVEHVICGTPAYMAPEQALTGRATSASDWYAVGVMLYQLIAQRTPHSGYDPGELFRNKQLVDPQPLSSLVQGVPSDLVSLASALLQRDAAQRPTTLQLLDTVRGWSGCGLDSDITGRTSSPPIAASSELVGRTEIFPHVERALREVRGSQPALIVLEGPSGIGKTTLLRHVVERLQQVEDAFVLEGRCYHRENVSYKAFDGVIDQLSRILRRLPPEQSAQLIPRHLGALLRLFPVLKRVDIFREAASRLRDQDSEYELAQHGLDATRELLCRIADRRALVLVIDDLQWGDADSTRLLAHVTGQPNAPRMLVVASVRSDDAGGGQMCEQWMSIESLRSSRITLNGLSEVEAVRLVRSVLAGSGPESASLVQSIAHDADGIPLYLVELAQGYLAGQLGSGPPTLHQMISSRIQRLSPEAQLLLNLVAVAGRPLPRAATAHSVGEAKAADATHELRRARLLRVIGSGNDHSIDVYHDRVRDVAASTLSECELQATHRVLAESLQATNSAGSEVLAIHWRGAGDLGKAAHHAQRAAEEAVAAFAFNRAADLYQLALDIGGDDLSLSISYAHALSRCGRSAAAAEVFMNVAQRSPARQKSRFEAAAATQWLRSGHVEEATGLLHDVLARVGVVWPTSQPALISGLLMNRARIRMTRLGCELRQEAEVPAQLLDQLDAIYPAQTAFGTFDYLRGAFFASLALPLALRAGEPERLTTALASEAVYGAMLSGSENLRRQRRVQLRLESLAAHTRSNYGLAAVQLTAAVCAYWTGDWDQVTAPANAAERGFRNDVVGGMWEVTLVRSVRNTVYVHAGKLAELAAELPALVAEARARNDLYAYMDLARSLTTIQLARADYAAAAKEFADLHALGQRLPFTSLRHLMLSTSVALLLYAGDAQRAARVLETTWKECRSSGLHRFPLLRATVLGMQADCVFTDQHQPARRRRRRLLELANELGEEPIAWANAAASSLRARACELVDDYKQERLHLTAAARDFRSCGLSLPAALSEQRLAANLDQTAAREERLPPAAGDPLHGSMIADPERWRRIMHSIY
jgi:serine/threonine protein kinase